MQQGINPKVTFELLKVTTKDSKQANTKVVSTYCALGEEASNKDLERGTILISAKTLT